ncbi:cell wall metabolism sensor histidine kinase WalK [Paenibacillus thermoaerophilus]|uniref:histidine kinase n=1 Tax=Paenibacillus thermoaerophilus TaxID=1215385 RepID=A0ABW2V4Q7_9BACL|nr:cell wall metabolism sensor histidine kinase WalK [Paenibacillus thermoaerophilus]TMV06615.1 cell wall metabolism sensor histidine kinase WalK [Paenibacillus thermoaerophilus]
MKGIRLFRTIRLKLNIIYVLLILVAMQVIFVYFVRTMESSFRENYADSLRDQAVFLADIAKEYLSPKTDSAASPEDKQRGFAQLADLFPDNRKEIQIIDANGIIRSSTSANAAEPGSIKSTQPEVIQALQSGKSIERDLFDPLDGKPKKLVAQPIAEGDKVLGVVYIIGSMEELYNTMDRINQIFVSGLLIALGLTAVLGVVLSHTITSPIQEMTKQATAVAEGRYDQRVRVRGEDEIGQLAQAFNHMTHRLKEALSINEEETEKLASILSNMNDGVIAADIQGRVILMNRRAREMLGLPRGEESEDTQREMESLLGVPRQELLRHMRAGGGVAMIELGQEEAPLSVRVVFSPIHRRDRGDTGIIAVLQDVTEQEKLERSRREFVADVSHELRTPLTTIKSYLEALEDGALDDPALAHKFVGVTRNETERMIRLVNDLLQLSRLDSRQWIVTKERTDIVDMLDEVADRFSVQTQNRNIRIHIQAESGVRYAWLDRDQIDQVLDNLVSNAVKYTPDGGTIRIAAGRRGDKLQVSVEDNGIGIPKKDLERIFERFYRVDKARSRGMGGTGLGLSIAREIIKAHGGTIEMESEVNKGTKVTFTIPLEEGGDAE